MILKISFYIVLFLLLNSCGNLTKNQIDRGTFTVRNGVLGDKSWSEDLEFDRTSWFQELSLLHEVFISEIKKDDPFWQWFSASNKESLSRCHKAFIILSYQLDSKRFSSAGFFSQLEKYGLRKVLMPTFEKHFRLHPIYISQSFNFYKSHALCLEKNVDLESVVINAPGFSNTYLFKK